MTILQKILSEIEAANDTEKIRQLCDQINKEELPNVKHPAYIPTGPNIFLALEVPGRNNKEIAFVTLERDTANVFLSVLYTMPVLQMRMPDASLKKQKVWVIEDGRPERILTSYAKTYKYLRGE